MDSRVDTYHHIHTVQEALYRVTVDLLRRALQHDQSKLVSPEIEAFDEVTARLRDLTYDSPEYKACLASGVLKPALQHHYASNDHHPEYYGSDVCVQCGAKQSVSPCSCGGPLRASTECMSLVSLLEMLCDWKAASMRHADGDIRTSIELNQKRFGYSDELKRLLLNTLPLLES